MKPLLSFVLCVFGVLPTANAEAVIRPGDHVALVGNSFADMMRKHGYFETLVRQRLGEISMRNLGWAGDTVTIRQRPTNFPTEDQTLAAHKTDLIIVCFGMGESFDGEAGLGSFRSDLEKLLKHYQSQKYNGKSPPRLAILSPIAYENLGDFTPDPEGRNADLASYTAAMRAVAKNNDVPFIDLFTATRSLALQENAPNITTNGVRLNAYGYWIASHLLADALAPRKTPWSLKLDAASGEEAAPSGFGMHDIVTAPGGVQFKIEESAWADPALPESALHDELPFERDQLAVPNLAPGHYTLNIDGRVIATATHEEWAKGVAIDRSPTHREADKFRAAVIDKNNQFFHSWRALNQVHIVGERKKSPSGRALPAEVIEFNQLAAERERSLQYLDPPRKTRTWTLAPAAK